MTCVKCRAWLSAPIRFAGKSARCPLCGCAQQVPHAPAPVAAAAATGNGNGSADAANDWRLPPRVAHEPYLAVLDEAADARRKSVDIEPPAGERWGRLDRLGWALVAVNVATLIAIVVAIAAPLPARSEAPDSAPANDGPALTAPTDDPTIDF